MGGSFVEGVGGHNPLEAARLEAALVTGPHVFNAREIYAEMFAEVAAIEAADEGRARPPYPRPAGQPGHRPADRRGGRRLCRAPGRGARRGDGVDRTPVARMKLSTPRWWYERGGGQRQGSMPIVRAALTPISWIWAAVTARRIGRTTPDDPGVPVICVGNLTLAAWARRPSSAPSPSGWRRRGAAHGPGRPPAVARVWRPAGRSDPCRPRACPHRRRRRRRAADAGPRLPGLDRPRPGRRAPGSPPPPGRSVIVMDDGHQNPSVRKTLSLVVVDGETRGEDWPFGDGRVFPAGPMREPLAAGLARADAVVVLLPADLSAPDPELTAHAEGPARPGATCARRRRAAGRATGGLRWHRQTVESGARPEGRRLRAGRLRTLPRPRGL